MPVIGIDDQGNPTESYIRRVLNYRENDYTVLYQNHQEVGRFCLMWRGQDRLELEEGICQMPILVNQPCRVELVRPHYNPTSLPFSCAGVVREVHKHRENDAIVKLVRIERQ